ncbi:glycosyltransferase [Actinospongicola halichondriae]|uniref:glycosyltransferase n=1 Tax=Actinospongicola halichondriae TaxID=3236844 RepID=UPI003D5C9A6C
MPLLPRPTLGSAARLALLVVAIARIARGATRSDPIGRSPRPATTDGPADLGSDVTIVIPARDEADRIGPCVRALAPTTATILVVDDGSSDATREVAEGAGATVVSAGPLPDGWAGKAHALQVGLDIAATATVVTLDADTRAHPDFLPAIISALGDRAMVSAGARVDAPIATGRAVHASMLATLVYRFGPPGVPARSVERVMANGQCMAFDREALIQAGGFAPVAGSLTEDVELARHLAAAGLDVAFEDATSVLDVEGYGGARDTVDGWGRSLALREVTSAPWMAADLAVLWSTMALPVPRLLAGRGDIIDVAALALRLGVAVATRGAFRQHGWPLLAAPLADPLVALRVTSGAIRPATAWRGRDYAVS